MQKHYILSVLCDDKPGIVKTIAETVSTHGGNWLESRLAQMNGKFAGVIRVSTAAESGEALSAALQQLKAQNISVQVEALEDKPKNDSHRIAVFSLAGPDRPGIIKELTTAFMQNRLNVQEITTRCTSMPYSGEPLFEAEGTVLIGDDDAMGPLLEQLDAIADSLALDIRLEDPEHLLR